MHLIETFLREVRTIRDSGAGVAETSYYPAVSALLNAAGRDLRPPVRSGPERAAAAAPGV